MDTGNAIEVKDVKKKFKLYLDKGKMLKERAINWSRNKYEERWVLNGISFEIKKGEAVGLIGHNGCGKSTTLKLLTKIMYPDSGTIEMNGRVSSLLELGAGFHPDLSGRENIYINASIFGLTRHEIDERLEEIIAFSELEEFIDNPVRTYSSGMYMRLAFSVAINVNADILLIDEILAVGDVNFQAKCFNKLMEIKKQGVTIVLVSHSTGQIEQLCERSIWIHDGLIRMDGKAKMVHTEYLLFMGEKRKEHAEKVYNEKITENEKTQRVGTGESRIESVVCMDKNEKICKVFNNGEMIKLKMKYHVSQPVENVVISWDIFRVDGVQCYGTSSLIDECPPIFMDKDGEIAVTFNNIALLPGKYYVNVGIISEQNETIDSYENAASFEIFCVTGDRGIARIPHVWE
ncbi:ABC transporter ATP-binding protein [Lachnospiraceae bacterium MD335]|nr:ABC transporter ATP-binding protein [Lachnospiraceae bacterium MD335]